MSNYILLGIMLLVIVFGALTFLYFRAAISQMLTDRKRQRAHAGKIMCDDEDCNQIAVRLTPNGYFCEFHWEPMSKRKMEHGGYITWSHELNHWTHRTGK